MNSFFVILLLVGAATANPVGSSDDVSSRATTNALSDAEYDSTITPLEAIQGQIAGALNKMIFAAISGRSSSVYEDDDISSRATTNALSDAEYDSTITPLEAIQGQIAGALNKMIFAAISGRSSDLGGAILQGLLNLANSRSLDVEDSLESSALPTLEERSGDLGGAILQGLLNLANSRSLDVEVSLESSALPTLEERSGDLGGAILQGLLNLANSRSLDVEVSLESSALPTLEERSGDLGGAILQGLLNLANSR